MNNWKLRKAFTGNNTSDVQTINGYIAAGEDNDFSVEVSPVGKEYPAPLVVPRTNLLPYSEYFDGWSIKSGTTATSNSIISPEGLQNASTISATTSLTNYIGENYTFTASTEYSYSVFVKNGTSSKMRLQVYDSSQYSTIDFDQSDSVIYSVNLDSYDFVDYGNGWRRVIITFTTSAGAGSGYVQIYPDRNGNNEYLYAYGAMLEEGSQATEYIPTNGAAVTRSWDSFSRVQNQVPGICNGTHTHTGAASGGGIAATTLTGTGSGGKFKYEFDTLGKLTLIEAMTHENLLLQSNQFDTTWTTTNASVTSGESGYDGSSDAWLLQTTASGGRVVQSISTSGVSTYSIYAKAGNVNWIALYAAGSPIPYVYFDLQNGEVGTSVGGNTIDEKIESVGNGWYRCSITANASINEVRVFVATADNTLSAASGDNIYIQDAQLEGGSQATGYIETTTAPVREGAGQGYKVDDKLSITTNEGHDIEFRLVEGSNATTVTVGMEATKPNKPVPFPVTKMRVADSTDRQVLIMDQRSRYVFPKPTPYLLDTYEGAAAAYSLRRLRSAYTGPAVRVRRESNNDELDIYFDGQGNLDTASLEAFCAGTNGFVKVWYDQGPGANDTEQTTTANQPQIVASGSVITEGGKPALRFGGSPVGLPFDNTALDIGNLSSFAVMKYSDTSGNEMGLGLSATATKRWYAPYLTSGVFAYAYGNSAAGAATTADDANNLHTMIAGTTLGGMEAFLNGATLGTQTLATGIDTTNSGIGNLSNNFHMDGFIQEVIVYDSDQSTNRTGIETNINEHYNIYEFSGLLDDYSGAAAAYSLRRLSSTYTGPAIRVVKHDVGYPEMDIPFEDDGTLSVVLLEAFADGYDATVKVWYDQSGGSNDAEQSTLASQPKIVSSGSVVTENGKPAIQGDGTNGKHLTTSNTTLSGDLAFVAVCAFNTSGLNAMIFGGTQPASRSYLWRQAPTTLNWKNDSETGFNSYTVSLLAANNLIFGNRAGTDVSMSVNGSNNTLTENATQGLDFTINRIGGGFSDGYSLDGTYQEMIFYNSDQSANRTGIESNINDFYSIYP